MEINNEVVEFKKLLYNNSIMGNLIKKLRYKGDYGHIFRHISRVFESDYSGGNHKFFEHVTGISENKLTKQELRTLKKMNKREVSTTLDKSYTQMEVLKNYVGFLIPLNILTVVPMSMVSIELSFVLFLSNFFTNIPIEEGYRLRKYKKLKQFTEPMELLEKMYTDRITSEEIDNLIENYVFKNRNEEDFNVKVITPTFKVIRKDGVEQLFSVNEFITAFLRYYSDIHLYTFNRINEGEVTINIDKFVTTILSSVKFIALEDAELNGFNKLSVEWLDILKEEGIIQEYEQVVDNVFNKQQMKLKEPIRELIRHIIENTRTNQLKNIQQISNQLDDYIETTNQMYTMQGLTQATKKDVKEYINTINMQLNTMLKYTNSNIIIEKIHQLKKKIQDFYDYLDLGKLDEPLRENIVNLNEHKEQVKQEQTKEDKMGIL